MARTEKAWDVCVQEIEGLLEVFAGSAQRPPLAVPLFKRLAAFTNYAVRDAYDLLHAQQENFKSRLNKLVKDCDDKKSAKGVQKAVTALT